MQKVNRLQGKWQGVVFLVIALLVAAADQLSKTWIRSYPPDGRAIFEAGFFRIIHIQNTGAAFGLFQGQSFALTIVALVGVVVILLFAFLVYRHTPYLNNMLSRVALGLVLGGTVGNLIDRLCFGSVTDFIDFGFWPAFNIADSAITVGIIIFLYSLLFLTRVEKTQDGQSI
jgi:signal peptidase II